MEFRRSECFCRLPAKDVPDPGFCASCLNRHRRACRPRAMSSTVRAAAFGSQPEIRNTALFQAKAAIMQELKTPMDCFSTAGASSSTRSAPILAAGRFTAKALSRYATSAHSRCGTLRRLIQNSLLLCPRLASSAQETRPGTKPPSGAGSTAGGTLIPPRSQGRAHDGHVNPRPMRSISGEDNK